MTILTKTLTYTFKTPNLTSIQRFSLSTGLMINVGGWEMSLGIVLEECPGGGKCWGCPWSMSGYRPGMA